MNVNLPALEVVRSSDLLEKEKDPLRNIIYNRHLFKPASDFPSMLKRADVEIFSKDKIPISRSIFSNASHEKNDECFS